MRWLKYLFFVLHLVCVGSPIVALQRDYACDEYCGLHQKHLDKLDLIRPYIFSIPTISDKCSHLDCPTCNKVWTFYDRDECDMEDGESPEPFWICLCKEKLMQENYEKYFDCCMPNWIPCKKYAIYDGYLASDKYFSMFFEYLQYVDQNKNCKCFWPELSKKAASINNLAYDLFKELFSNTKLGEMEDNLKMQNDFLLKTPMYGYNLHGIIISFVSQSFFYSDYDWVCRDIDFYSSLNFDDNSLAIIRNKLDHIREKLAVIFLDFYLECLKKHPNQRIKQELCLVRSFLNVPLFDYLKEDKINTLYTEPNFLKRAIDVNNLPIKKNKRLNKYVVQEYNKLNQPYRPNNWSQSDVHLAYGTSYNDSNLYNEAIRILTIAIHLNPVNRNAYIERAMAYFETDQIQLALQDYEIAKKLTIAPPFKSGNHKAMLMAAVYIPENKTEFSKGLVSGTVDGAKVSTVEFIPSIFSCCRGILNGLWAFVCSPIDVSQEMINTAYAIGEFISNHSTEECFQCVVPELKELSLSWDKLNDNTRGQKIGFIIGKYGVDIFAPVGALKGMSKVRALKRANTMCTLEQCTISQAKKTKILQESINRTVIRENIIKETTKNRKLLVKNSNVQYHVMQQKHAWDKVINISKIVEEDFKKVILLLEENCILSEKYLLESEKFANGKIIRTNYQMTINGCEVKVVFETYLETNQTFLKDGWVITR